MVVNLKQIYSQLSNSAHRGFVIITSWLQIFSQNIVSLFRISCAFVMWSKIMQVLNYVSVM